jgi:hypothetical protein
VEVREQPSRELYTSPSLSSFPLSLYFFLTLPIRLPPAVDYQLINEKSGATIAYDHFSKDSTLIADDADRARYPHNPSARAHPPEI